MLEYFGLIGLVLILLGWATETVEVLKKKKVSIPLSFAALYGVGSLLLTIHSISIQDAVFTILNAFATLIALVNLYFIFFPAREKKKKRRKR